MFAFLLLIFALLSSIAAHELCLDGEAPREYSRSFRLCEIYNGQRTCVNPRKEKREIRRPLKRKLGFNRRVAPDCFDLLARLECSQADAWAGHLFDSENGSKAKDVPFLCSDFAKDLFEACSAIELNKNLFLDSKGKGSISEQFGTMEEFQAAFGPSDESSFCFNGSAFSPPSPEPFVPDGDSTICVEKVLDGSYPDAVFANVVGIPGHLDLMALGSQSGLVQIFRIQPVGQAMEFVGTLIDHSVNVRFKGEQGLLGIAFHKEFAANGRFFLSYSCERRSYCRKTKASIVEEFIVADPTRATSLVADTSLPKRIILQLSQPFGNHNGGQILFSPDPKENNLFLMLGDGGAAGDPGNRAQNKRSLFGKILRINIDIESGRKKYGIPKDNPFRRKRGWKPEIWALGLRNPWRCSFDSETFWFFCGDVGQGQIETVNLIVRAGNYGWRRWEGSNLFSSRTRLARNTAYVRPVMEYSHAQNDANGRGSIIGGYIYRGSKDIALSGKYVFADFYDRLYVGSESPPGSAQFQIQQFGLKCSTSSPLPCVTSSRIITFGQDQNHDLYFFSASTGLHRIVDPQNC